MRKAAPKLDHPYIFSVSQAETFRLCPRKWAYQKIDNLSDPGSPSTVLGSALTALLGAPNNLQRTGVFNLLFRQL